MHVELRTSSSTSSGGPSISQNQNYSRMRKLWLSKEDFELFHNEIGPFEFEFFRTHMDAFKRMWREQVGFVVQFVFALCAAVLSRCVYYLLVEFTVLEDLY